jgi:hypothetical protein
MRIDFEDDLLAGLAKLHEHRGEFEKAFKDGILQRIVSGDHYIYKNNIFTFDEVVDQLIDILVDDREVSLIIKQNPDYMYNTRTSERVEIPDRLHEEPEVGYEYYIEAIDGSEVIPCMWDGSNADKRWFNNGLIHKTKESAEIARKARLGL